MKIHAREHIGMGFPPDEGKRLADYLIDSNTLTKEPSLMIDVSDLTAGLLISAFFNGFLQEIHDRDPQSLDKARKIQWQLAHTFQKENVHRWMNDFQPYEPGRRQATN